jgi:hypothetical protein
LVEGEGFAVNASVIEANASRSQRAQIAARAAGRIVASRQEFLPGATKSQAADRSCEDANGTVQL